MNRKYRLLGSLRCVLAMTVVLSHTWFLAFPNRNLLTDIGIGNFAVMGFFVLSGFIIAEAVDLFYQGRPGAFLANRLMRLAPPFWVATAVSIIAHYVLAVRGTLRLPDYSSPPIHLMFDPGNLAIQLTAIFPIFNVNRFLPKIEWYYFVRFSWAIFVEFVFYFYVAACMFIWPLARRFFTLRSFLFASAAAALLVHAINEYVWPLHTSFSFIPYFTLGVALYGATSRQALSAWLLASVSYVMLALHYIRYTQGQLSPWTDGWSGATRPVVFVPTSVMVAIPLVMVALSKIDASAQTSKIDRWIGDLSYPLYLNHYAVLVVFYSVTKHISLEVQLLAVVSSLAIAFLLQAAVDRPIRKLRDSLRGESLGR